MQLGTLHPVREGSTVGRLCSQLLAEPTVMLLFTVPLNGYTIVATAFIVTPYSSSAQPCLRGPTCRRSVCVAMSCVGGFFSPGGAYNSVWDSVKPLVFQHHLSTGCPAAGVYVSRCRVVVEVSILTVLMILYGSACGRWLKIRWVVFLHAEWLVQQHRRYLR